jgi:hypothetical protein
MHKIVSIHIRMKNKYKYSLLLIMIFRIGMANYGLPQESPNYPDTLALPFSETWDGGSIGYQGWTGDSNWVYDPADGNPAPCAEFTWQPVLTNYTSSLTSTTIDCSGWSCATIWLDFDFMLNDQSMGGTEKLDVDCFWDYSWHRVAEMKNTGSVGWTSEHIDITNAAGQGMKVRFRANGLSTSNIFDWYIDNISVYGIGNPPTVFLGTQCRDTVILTWEPPQCEQNGETTCLIFDDGSMENGWSISPGYTAWLGNFFPVTDSLSGTLQSFEMEWYNNTCVPLEVFQIDVFSQTGTLLGSSQTFQLPIPAPPTFMTLTLTNGIPFNGAFYGMIKWNGFPSCTSWLGFDENGPYASQDLGYYYDGTTFTPINIFGGGNPGVFTVRACGVINSPYKMVKPADSSFLTGYNVYRYDSTPGGIIPFRKLNTSLLAGTDYTDVLGLDTLQYGIYEYYVTDVFNDSQTGQFLYESAGTDTITIQFPSVGIRLLSGGFIMIYPNPANDFVHVKSDYTISRIEVMNLAGQTVYNEIVSNPKLAKINTKYLQAGVYFVKVTTSKGIRTARITVIR